MPKSEIRMDQQTKRRWIERFGILAPTHKGQERWSAEGKQRFRPECFCDTADDAHGPAVHGAGPPVARLRGGREGRPAYPAGDARKYNCAGRESRHEIVRTRMKCATVRKAGIGNGTLNVGGDHMFRRYWPPTSNSVSLIWPSEHTRTASIRTANTFSFLITAWRKLSRIAGASAA